MGVSTPLWYSESRWITYESPINHLRITKESLKNHQRFTSAFQVNNALAYKEISWQQTSKKQLEADKNEININELLGNLNIIFCK